jgi:signal transduction histidine kinase/ActR/RegA family two-component response regulator
VKQQIIENWLLKPAQYDLESIVRSQIQQTWARLVFAVASLIYLSQHAIFFTEFIIQITLISSVYFIYNVLTIITIRRTPLSAFRTLFAPFFDVFIICYGMMIDGGHSSGMFYILFIIIIGNSFRFGNPLMVYTQLLTFFGLSSVIIYLLLYMQIMPDNALLAWQLFGLLSIPFYVYLIRKKSEDQLRIAHNNLENMVQERTQELQQTNEKLVREAEEKVEALQKMEYAEMKYQHAQKMESLGTLVGGIAHDFNNMLSGITANLFLIQRQIQSAEVSKRLDKIGDLTMHAADMIKQLMTFARKSDVQMKQFDLRIFFSEAFKLARVSISEHIHCYSILPEDELLIQGDTTQIQQILMNLMNNARDALSGVEQPSIRVSLRRFTADGRFLKKHPDARPGEYAVIAVHDNGCGISKDKINRVFEPFFTTKAVGEGTGLGLAMIYGAVQMHGGVIDVKSRVGEGTEVSIYLPVIEENSNAIEPDAVSRIIEGHGEVILLVDDDESLLEANKELLIMLGYRVLTACNGQEAVSVYQKQQDEIDLVVMDIVMPLLGGVSAADHIHKLNPQAEIIFITGYDKDNRLSGEMASDSYQVLSKPVVVEELSRVIHQRLHTDYVI